MSHLFARLELTLISVCQFLENSKINSISMASPHLQNLTRKFRTIGFSEITFVMNKDIRKVLQKFEETVSR